MSVTLTVERYDSMQEELADLRLEVDSWREGKLVVRGRYLAHFGTQRRVVLPNDVIEALNKELLERVIYLEAKVLPDAAERKKGWWHSVFKWLKDADNDSL